MNRRQPFLSNSACRGLLFLEWIIIVVVIGASVWSWHGQMKPSDFRKNGMRDVASNPVKDRTPSRSVSYAVPVESVETFPFDPNTADSTMLLKLGLAPWQVRAIYKYRARNGRYHTPEEFKRLPGMTYGLWERLGPQIRIARQFRYIDESGKRSSFSEQRASLARTSDERVVAQQTDSAAARPRKFETVTQVDINRADTAELMRIPGIGSYRANMIVEYRRKLGGFKNAEQVMEACELPDGILQWVRVSADVPTRKVNVNKLSLQRLMNHPYITFYQARAMVEYRKAFGNIKGIDDLRGLEGFTPLKIEKLQPYLEF